MTAIGEYTGVAAVSLLDFLDKLKTVDTPSIVFHLYRRDFQQWIQDWWHYDDLVEDLDLIVGRALEGECLRQQLLNVVAFKVTE
jgi:hypothetical protein